MWVDSVDNSEWMRNGDYFPTRMEEQTDAVNMLMGWKFQDNPENTVGILKMAKGAEVLVTPTADVGKVLSALHKLRICGEVDLLASIQVAQLALKHRQNKNQQQRMILFVGSPISADTAALKRLGAGLKKNKVAADVVLFGEVKDNVEKLETFIGAVNNNDNSHLVMVEPGTATLKEVLRSSPLSPSRGGGATGAAGGGGADFPFDVDPNEDPELLMAIRASMEEERQRQEREKGSTGGAEQPAAVPASGGGVEAMEEDEDALIQQAIALSMSTAAKDQEEAAAKSQQQPQPQATKTAKEEEEEEEEEMDEDMRLALEMSMNAAAAAGGEATKEEKKAEAPTAAPLPQGESVADPKFVQSILETLPGVDTSDPQIQALLQGMQQQQASSGGGAQQPTRTYSLEELKQKPAELDGTKLETYLSDEDFARAFGMTKTEFYAQPVWKQKDMKAKLGLF
ncbi:proteasome regulatory particle base subunit rpn10, variant 2 [Balamuthia mandrillaris]